MAAASASASAHSSNGARVAAGGGVQGGHTVHTRMRAAAAQSLHSSPQSPFGGSSDGAAEELTKGAAATTTAFTYESFLLGCIMAGCDYVANLRNIGIKKAFKLVAHATSLRQVFATLETEYGFPAEELAHYRRRLLEAFYCFAHHLVYCPLRQEITTFHPLPAPPSNGTGAAATLKTQLVGEMWDASTAQDVCVRCLTDPCTLRLYRGTYQSCLSRYLQRTRRGQTSLKTYAGFEEMTSGKVVVHLEKNRPSLGIKAEAVGMKRERAEGSAVCPTETSREDDAFASPLRKRQEARGYLGTTSTALGNGGRGGPSGQSEVVVVRSRYFLMRGRTAVCEQWSASEEEEETEVLKGRRGSGVDIEDGQVGEECTAVREGLSLVGAASPVSAAGPRAALDGGRSRLPRPSHGASFLSSLSSAAKSDSGSTDDVASTALTSADSTAPMRLGDAASCDSESGNCNQKDRPDEAVAAPSPTTGVAGMDTMETPDVEPYAYHVTAEASATAAPSVPPCACPFGYWQCNRAHSVFESCFLGRQWSRDAGPRTTEVLASSLPTSPADHGNRTAVSPDTAIAAEEPRRSALASSCNGTSTSSDRVRGGPQGYVPRAFRPPRSTVSCLPPSSTTATSVEEADSAGVVEACTPLESAEVPPEPPSHARSSRAAAASSPSSIFAKMTFKKDVARGTTE